jgi:hypothetical protein
VATRQTPVRSIQGQSIGVRAWPIWSLPDRLIAFVVAVVLADATAAGLAASTASFHAHGISCAAPDGEPPAEPGVFHRVLTS